MPTLQQFFDPNERPYEKLYPHFARREYGLRGDAIVAFVGPCRVCGDELVDWEDRLAGDFIAAASMLHFVAEHFGVSLREAVLRQRLLASLVRDAVGEAAPDVSTRRDGDDIFVGERKLSVSIATVSLTSAVIHFGVNVDAAGAPVPAIGLRELGIDPTALGRSVMERYAREDALVADAVTKVRGLC